MYVRKVFCELLSNNLEFNFEPTCSIFFWTSFDGSISSEHLYSVTRYYLVNKMLLFTKIFQPRLVLSLSITFVDFYYKHQKGYKINKMTNQSWPPSQNFKNLDGRFQNQIKHQPPNVLWKTTFCKNHHLRYSVRLSEKDPKIRVKPQNTANFYNARPFKITFYKIFCF